MYYLRSENKDTDQLRSYFAADLRLCFRICKSRFPHDAAQFVCEYSPISDHSHGCPVSGKYFWLYQLLEYSQHFTQKRLKEFTIQQAKPLLARKAPNTTIAEFANTIDPDETAHNEPSHLDLQCLPSIFFLFFNIKQFLLKVFRKFADVILSSAFLALYELEYCNTCIREYSDTLNICCKHPSVCQLHKVRDCYKYSFPPLPPPPPPAMVQCNVLKEDVC